MSTRCVSCGAENPPVGELCAHHVPTEADWSSANRIMCDFVHRGIDPAYVAFADFYDEHLIA